MAGYPPPGNYPGQPYPGRPPYPPQGYPQQPGYPPQRPPYPPQPGYPPQAGYPGQQPYPPQPSYPGPGYPQQPGYPGGPGPSSNKKPLLIIAAVVVVLVVIIGGGLLLFSGASSTFALTDEAKIKAVMRDIANSKPGPNAELYCRDVNKLLERYSKDFGGDLSGVSPGKDTSKTEITSIDVNGDEAEVHLRNSVRGSGSIRFVKEDGKWKMCPSMPSIPDMP